jgi:peptidoglycan hydrolase-like protein with peptidoglycan-binding domain
MTGPAVSRVQETLRSRGFYQDAIDGIFGPATEAAVMEFQRSVQLADDGVVGPATWQALLQS